MDLSKKKKMIKTINSKMTRNSQLSTTEPKTMKMKTKPTTRTVTEQRNGHHMEGFQWGEEGEEWGEGTGNKKHNWQAQNRQGEVKNGIRNREVKELICTTHGHELSGGGADAGGLGGQGEKGQRGKMGKTVIA